MRKGLSSQEKKQRSVGEAAKGKAIYSQLMYTMPFLCDRCDLKGKSILESGPSPLSRTLALSPKNGPGET